MRSARCRRPIESWDGSTRKAFSWEHVQQSLSRSETRQLQQQRQGHVRIMASQTCMGRLVHYIVHFSPLKPCSHSRDLLVSSVSALALASNEGCVIDSAATRCQTMGRYCMSPIQGVIEPNLGITWTFLPGSKAEKLVHAIPVSLLCGRGKVTHRTTGGEPIFRICA